MSGNSNEDEFEDLMGRTHGDYESMREITTPKVLPDKSGQGLCVQFNCPSCASPRAVVLSWLEIYCIAHLVNPMLVGVTDTYQANAHNATGFGPVTPCRCGQQKEASFFLEYHECQRYFYAYQNAFRSDRNVVALAPHIMQLKPKSLPMLQ